MASDNIEKIAVNKNDEPTAIAEKLIDSEADTVILSIPKFSKFAESISNFKLIKRESDILEKNVIVESVDEDAIALAEESGLEASNPFFGRMSKQQFSDIRVAEPRKSKKAQPKEKPAPEKKELKVEPKKETTPKKEEAVPTVVPIKNLSKSTAIPEPIQEPIRPRQEIEHETARRTETPSPMPIITHYSDSPSREGLISKIKKYQPIRPKKPFFKRAGILIVLVLIIFGLLPYLAFAVLPRAEITIETEKKPWEFEGSVAALTTLTEVSTVNNRIPGQIFSQENNLTLTFPASGVETIERKATGQLIIYNGFSSEPQPLVATTRFQTPDGKIFRIVEGVTVPGAKIEDGKVAASSISVDIVADQAGDEYNLAKVERLAIPGFSGTPKFNSFYGEIKTPTSGGFVGEAKVATEEDVEKALAEAGEQIQESTGILSGGKIPEGFTVLEGANAFEIIDQDVNREADASGKFSIYTEGAVRQFAFKEDQLIEMLRKKASAQLGENYVFDSYDLEYTGVKADFENQLLTLTISFTAQLEKPIDSEATEERIRGKKEAELTSIINSIDGVKKAEISLWPFWVKTVPQSPDKVKVVVD